jgi:uncharacterized RDD family membrane protein YckC
VSAARTRAPARRRAGALAALTREREVVTPEGVPLRLTLARAGDRASAFVLDFMILFVSMLLFLLLVGLASDWDMDESWAPGIGMLAAFLLRTFYFTWFEVRWQGRTPGKRSVGIRVIDAGGASLRTDAVIVRNLMREVELWLPMMLLIAHEQVWPDSPGWVRLLSMLWALALGFFPLFNRERLRVGDLVAGTKVVLAPKAMLLADLGGEEIRRRKRKAERGAKAAHEFTQAQLDIYGIYELQVLEEVLRRSDLHRREAIAAVSKKIRRKIRWRGKEKDHEGFLKAFYAALRARLEQKMLLGKRKRDKHAKE